MPIYDFPDIIPDNEAWNIKFNNQVFASALTGSTQVGELDGAKWQANLTFTNRDGRDARALRGLLLKLRGKSGQFYLSPSDKEPIGTAAGIGVSDGATSAGVRTITTRSWTSGQALLFAVGDWISINNELKQIVEDVASDGSGNATLTFEPALRNPIPDGTTIEKTDPKGIFRLKVDDSGWDTSTPIIYAMTVQAIEVIS